jgi:hypothetical protein
MSMTASVFKPFFVHIAAHGTADDALSLLVEMQELVGM